MLLEQFRSINKFTIATAAFTGLLCGLMGGFAGNIGLAPWAGFAGCVAYFCCPERKWRGVRLTAVTCLVGVGMGWLQFQFADALGGKNWSFAISVGLLVMVTVLLGEFRWTAFVPGMFVGSYSLFAIEDDVTKLLASLGLGILMGLACDEGGRRLFAGWDTDTSLVAEAEER